MRSTSRTARLLEALFHHEFHADLESLKDLYAPFNPDLGAPAFADGLWRGGLVARI